MFSCMFGDQATIPLTWIKSNYLKNNLKHLKDIYFNLFFFNSDKCVSVNATTKALSSSILLTSINIRRIT